MNVEFMTPTFPITIQVDRSKMSQVIRNVVSNALKYNASGGSVRVKVDVIPVSEFDENMVSSKSMSHHKSNSFRSRTMNSRRVGVAPPSKPDEPASSHYLRIRVSDNGIGIAKEDQVNLFRGIIQFSPGELQQAGKGAGLGLYISKGIVDMHNGLINISSKGPGKGTVCTVVLPVQTGLLSEKNTTVTHPKTVPFDEASGHDGCAEYLLNRRYNFTSEIHRTRQNSSVESESESDQHHRSSSRQSKGN